MGLQVRMYADDLIAYLSCVTEVVAAIVHCLREFGVYTGLQMNVGKSKIILKGPNIHEDMERLGLSISNKVRYLGGHYWRCHTLGYLCKGHFHFFCKSAVFEGPGFYTK